MRWYADNSELLGVWEAELPDVLLFGGLALSRDEEVALRDGLADLKRAYAADLLFPVKWNFKDLGKWFEDRDQEELYKVLLANSKNWRRSVFQLLAGSSATLILSCLVSHGKKKETIKSKKQALTQMVFANGLMRLAMHASETSSVANDIVLDWPENADRQPFECEYASAYWAGESVGGGPKYISGPIGELGFSDAPLYASMQSSGLLQLSDLVVGATREFIKVAIGKEEDSFGLEMLALVAHLLRGYPDNIVGRGISVAPAKDSALRAKIDACVQEKLLA